MKLADVVPENSYQLVLLCELKAGDRYSKLKYPSSKFSYLNYDHDPRPHILILGKWNPKSTGKDLLAGINLNYLTKEQVSKLIKSLDRIFSFDNLKHKYRYISKMLPDIAKYYRTYDARYISKVEPHELKAVPSELDRIYQSAVPSKPQNMENDPEDISSNREKWTNRKRIDPDEIDTEPNIVKDKDLYGDGERNIPDEPSDDADYSVDDDALRASLASYDGQQGIQDDNVEDDEEDEEDEEETAGIGESFAVPAGKPIIHNNIPIFNSGGSFDTDRNLLAVHNVEKSETIMDWAISHDELSILAGWDCDSVVKFEIIGDELIISSHNDISESLVSDFINSDYYRHMLMHQN